MTIANYTFSASNTLRPQSLLHILRLCLFIIGANFLIFTNVMAQSYDFSSLYENLSPTVVTVITTEIKVTEGVSGEVKGLGSGVMVSDDLILTATHVVNKASTIEVKFKDGTQIQADVVTATTSNDVALIKLRKLKKDSVAAKFGNSSAMKIGEPVFVIGAPFGIEHTLSVGHLSGRHQHSVMVGGEPVEFLQTDTAINKGNSGGPMFNSKGEVIGIVSFILSKSGGFNGLGFATAIDGVRKTIREGSAFWAGFEGIMLSRQMSSVLNVPQGTGMLIQHVVKDSVAAKAGLRGGKTLVNIYGDSVWVGGDIVVEIQGTICDGPHNFRAIKDQLVNLQSGETFTIKVLRSGKIIDLTATKN